MVGGVSVIRDKDITQCGPTSLLRQSATIKGAAAKPAYKAVHFNLPKRYRQKTYCAASCASLALLALSGNDVGCIGGIEWPTTTKARERVAPLFYLKIWQA